MSYTAATSFTVTSVDHNEVLLGDSVKSIRNLLGTESLEETPLKLNFEFSIGGKTFSSELDRVNGVFVEGATLKLGGDNGEVTEVEMPKIYSYKSADRSWLFNFHSHEKFEGVVSHEGKRYHFTVDEGNLLVKENILENAGKNLRNLEEIAAEDIGNLNNIDYWSDCHGIQPSMGSLSMGWAIGHMMYRDYGTSTALNMLNSYIETSNLVYNNQMNINLEIADTWVATTSNAASWTTSSCSMTIQTQLDRFRSWSKPSRQDLWHALENCFGIHNTVLGIAYVGTLCSSSTNVGVDYVTRKTSTVNINVADYPTWETIGHEIGHNFNAQHSFEEGQGRTGGIMDYGPTNNKKIDGVTQFNTYYRQGEVCSEVNAAVRNGCISRALETEFVERRAESARNLECVKHSHRRFAGNDQLRVTRGGVTLGECKAECEDISRCSGISWNKRGHCELWENKEAEDLYFSPGFDSYFCGVEAPAGTKAEKTVDDLLQNVNVDNLSQLCCEVVENAHMEGMNAWYDEGISKARCHASCVMNSKCEAASWDITDEHCMYYSGVNAVEGYTGEYYHMPGATTLMCQRECLNNRALGVAGSDSGSIAMGVGVVGAALGLVAVGGAAYSFFGKKKANTEQCSN